jgi:pimeloyl-ACP methyl ester carboxylesterase
LVRHRWTNIDGNRTFYREAGENRKPLILLLHGFPSSSIQYRYLLHDLARQYRLAAPDYPAFGLSATPSASSFAYTFDNFARMVEKFVAGLGSPVKGLVLHDYGADIGFRLLERGTIEPKATVILGSQSYLDAGWKLPMFKLHERGNQPEHLVRQSLLESLLTEDGIRGEFTEKLSEDQRALIDPSIIQLAWNKIRQPEVTEAMLSLHLDYRHNFERYPTNHATFRALKTPSLILWGEQDQYVGPDGGFAYTQDLPNADVQVIEDGGHWLLETHPGQVAERIGRFFDRHLVSTS